MSCQISSQNIWTLIAIIMLHSEWYSCMLLRSNCSFRHMLHIGYATLNSTMLSEAWVFSTGNPFGRLGVDRGGALKCIEWLHGSSGISNFESPSNWRCSGKKIIKNKWDSCAASILQFSLYVNENDCLKMFLSSSLWLQQDQCIRGFESCWWM